MLGSVMNWSCKQREWSNKQREAAKKLLDEAREKARVYGFCDGKGECTSPLYHTHPGGTYCDDCGRPKIIREPEGSWRFA